MLLACHEKPSTQSIRQSLSLGHWGLSCSRLTVTAPHLPTPAVQHTCKTEPMMAQCHAAATKEATAPEPEMEQALAPDEASRGRLLRGSGLHLMLFGATVIIGAAAAPAPSPRLFTERGSSGACRSTCHGPDSQALPPYRACNLAIFAAHMYRW